MIKTIFLSKFHPPEQEFGLYLTKSIPNNFSSRSLAVKSLVYTASFPMQTPCSLAPISVPHIQAGLLRIVA